MMSRRLPAVMCLVLACLCVHRVAAAQQADPVYDTAVWLLERTSKQQAGGPASEMLLALRRLKDPALKPYFNALTHSRLTAQRVHANLALAELSKGQTLDLAVLAEIEDGEEFSSLLFAASDGELIDPAGLKTIVGWTGIDAWPRLVAAMQLTRQGHAFDPAPFREMIDIDPVKAEPKLQVRFHYAALILAEAGDVLGKAALTKLAGLREQPGLNMVALMLRFAADDGLKTIAPLTMSIARDEQHDFDHRLIAIHSALVLKQPNAADVWTTLYDGRESQSQRVRLAMAALSTAKHVPPSVLIKLQRDDNSMVRQIGTVAQAIAEGNDALDKAIAPLLEIGHPLPAQWLLGAMDQLPKAQHAALYERMILNHINGTGRYAQVNQQLAVDAVFAWCQADPEAATPRLIKLLQRAKQDPAHGKILRQIIYLGVLLTPGSTLPDLAKSQTDDWPGDTVGNAMMHLIRARHNQTLTKAQWQLVGNAVQGAGQLSASVRIQLAWVYLKNINKADQAIVDALK